MPPVCGVGGCSSSALRCPKGFHPKGAYMSEYGVLVIDTIGTWVIILLMIGETFRTERHNAAIDRGVAPQARRRSYWPWIAMAVIALAVWIPVYLTYTAPRAVKATDMVVSGPPTLPPTPSEREMLEAKGLSFSEQFVYNLRWDFLRLPRPCNLKMLAPPGMEAPRGQLVSAAMNASVQILNRPNGYYIPVCQIIDEQKDRTPLLYGPHSFPLFGIIIHTSESNVETREFLAEVFRSQSITVTGDSVLPPGSPANLIYIEFGRSLVQAAK